MKVIEGKVAWNGIDPDDGGEYEVGDQSPRSILYEFEGKNIRVTIEVIE